MNCLNLQNNIPFNGKITIKSLSGSDHKEHITSFDQDCNTILALQDSMRSGCLFPVKIDNNNYSVVIGDMFVNSSDGVLKIYNSKDDNTIEYSISDRLLPDDNKENKQELSELINKSLAAYFKRLINLKNQRAEKLNSILTDKNINTTDLVDYFKSSFNCD